MHNNNQRLTQNLACTLAAAAALLLPPLAQAEPPPANANPMAQAQHMTPTPTPATVLQQLAAGSYTYMQVRFDTPPPSLPAEAWIAVMGAGFAPDAHIEVTPFAARTDFFSPRLDRTFQTLIFASATPL